MSLAIDDFTKQHDYLICIDSDGTAIDAMNVKHRKCHGPSFIKVWGLEAHQEEVQKLWDKINLFDKTRGENRFIALVDIMTALDGKYLDAKNDIKILKQWMHDTKGLSNKFLKEAIAEEDNEVLKKALKWSEMLNEKIQQLTTDEKPPFSGVIDALTYMHGKADIAVVSSSNMDAILAEWGHYDMLKFLDVMTSQDVGTKGQCIARMLNKGYKESNVLMIGDAYPDVEASQANGVWYYPILTNREKESWDNLKDKYFDVLINGGYAGVQAELLTKFEDNFTK